jgi:hypothetical protein
VGTVGRTIATILRPGGLNCQSELCLIKGLSVSYFYCIRFRAILFAAVRYACLFREFRHLAISVIRKVITDESSSDSSVSSPEMAGHTMVMLSFLLASPTLAKQLARGLSRVTFLGSMKLRSRLPYVFFSFYIERQGRLTSSAGRRG